MDRKKNGNVSKYSKKPHDSYFMDTFSNKKSIISFLNAVLPEKVLKQIDLSKLNLI
jgi:hypothetical protein